MENTKSKKLAVSSNLALAIASVGVALIVWLTLNMTAFPEMTTTIRDVPIDYSLAGTYADVAGLSIISDVPETVNVKITGLRYDISDYTADDLKVTPNFDSVRTSGVYELSLNIVSADGDDITVDQSEPGTVHLEFDYFATKTFTVADGTLTADISNVYAEAGYIMDTEDVTISPESITISGPKDYVDSVTSCKVVLNEVAGLTESYSTGNTSIKLYSGDTAYESDRVVIENQLVNVKIPVYIKKLLNLDIEVQTYFDQFDLDSLKYDISPASIIVRSQNSAVENLSEISLGYIDLRQIGIGSSFTFDINDSSYYTNISGTETATVTFNLDNYSTKSVTLPNSQIHIINVPDGFNAYVETEKIRNITIVGPEEVINDIDATDVIGQIDLLDYNVNAGTHILGVNIYLPGHNDAWALGIHRIYIHIEPSIAEDHIANPDIDQMETQTEDNG